MPTAAQMAQQQQGLIPYKLISAATDNATLVKGSAGVVGFISVSNVNAAVRYLKLYDKATAPTVGTDVPVQTYLIPINGNFSPDLPPGGLVFTLGIGFGLVTGAADNSTTAVSAAEHVVNIGYR